MLHEHYLTKNFTSNEKEEVCALKQWVKTLEIENKFLRNDVVSKQNLTDSLLEYNSNLLDHKCCRVIQDTQSNVQIGIKSDVTDNHSNNHEVYTVTNEKTNKQTTCREKKDKTTVHRDNDDGNLITLQSAKKEVYIIDEDYRLSNMYMGEKILVIIQWKWEVILEQQQMTSLIMSDPLFEKNLIRSLFILKQAIARPM